MDRRRIPLVASAHRFAVGHRLWLASTSNDALPDSRPMHGFVHTTVGTAAVTTVHTARLLLPVMADDEESERDRNHAAEGRVGFLPAP